MIVSTYAALRSMHVPSLMQIRRFARSIAPGSYLLGIGMTLLLGGVTMSISGEDAQTAGSASGLTAVERRTLVSSVKATGTVAYGNEQTLRFNQKGTVAKVHFKDGDRIQKGQMIAELDTSSVLTDIHQAQLSVSASALQLQQLKSERDKSLIEAENTLREAERQFSEAENSLAVAREKLPTDLESAKRSVKEKESSLEQAQLELEKAQRTELQTLASTTQGILSDSEELLDSFYTILTRDSTARPASNNDTIEVYYLLFNDLSKKEQVLRSYQNATNGTKAIHDQYGTTIATERDPDELMQILTEAKDIAASVYALAESTYTMLLGASTDTVNFTTADLNAARSTVSGYRSSATALIGQAETALANLAAASKDGGIPSVTLKQKQDAVTTAKNALMAARDNLRILETQTPGDLQKQEAAVAKIQDDYKAKQAAYQVTTKSTVVNEQLKANDVAQKSASLQKTQKTLEDYQLKAPFDGVIRRIDYQVGDNLLDTGEEKEVILENPDYLIVTILLDQVDVVRVKKDMTATIEFDAVPDRSFQGTVDEINSTPVQSSGVVSYEVSIKLPTPADLTILSGMTTTVEIEIMKRESVLAVPSLALQYIGGKATVQTSDGKTVPVETGKTDGTYTEIVSGLFEGDEVVMLNTAAVSGNKATTDSRNIMRMTGGMGGPPQGNVMIRTPGWGG